MIVDKSTENYLIHSMGLTKKQIKEMLPSEVDKHCKGVIKQRIEERGIYNPNEKTEKQNIKSDKIEKSVSNKKPNLKSKSVKNKLNKKSVVKKKTK